MHSYQTRAVLQVKIIGSVMQDDLERYANK
jgi:hypothetical protein